MRKFIIFLLLIPAIASLGHDIYFFTQDQGSGFHLSDTGALWDKYHKESHDQWKNTVQNVGAQIENAVQSIDVDLGNNKNEPKDEINTANKSTGYQEGFNQSSERGKETTTTFNTEDNTIEENVGALQKYIGFLLEQKALFVFGGAAILFYILTAILALPFKEKSGMKKVEQHKRKGGGYKYGRK